MSSWVAGMASQSLESIGLRRPVGEGSDSSFSSCSKAEAGDHIVALVGRELFRDKLRGSSRLSGEGGRGTSAGEGNISQAAITLESFIREGTGCELGYMKQK